MCGEGEERSREEGGGRAQEANQLDMSATIELPTNGAGTFCSMVVRCCAVLCGVVLQLHECGLHLQS